MAFFQAIRKFLAPARLDVRERFELQREAISGTMSRFYVARDHRTGQMVGLKILDSKKTAGFEARFKGLKKPSEGEIASLFQHPNIVRTYEYGQTTDGSPYIVMELLDGGGMNTAIVGRDQRLEGCRLHYLRQGAEALDAVHEAGFLHRDICPRNFMFTADWQTLKLTDFGLAVPATPPFLQPGNRTGNPNYMAPELVRRMATDRRVDVFAFGATAYELCAYQLPWAVGATGMAALSHDQPATDIRSIRPMIHPELAAAIHACIEPDMRRRCPSMKEFLSMVRRLKSEDV
jgi:serine/threonine protein kinase